VSKFHQEEVEECKIRMLLLRVSKVGKGKGRSLLGTAGTGQVASLLQCLHQPRLIQFSLSAVDRADPQLKVCSLILAGSRELAV